MKIRSSLKKLKVRDSNLQVVRRGKRVYLVPKKPGMGRFKARQG